MYDPLRHFKGDGPWVRLTALLVCRAHMILGALGGVLLSVLVLGTLRGWW